MGKIKQLSDKLSNLIAAGEVVENMASVVKELVENAIDANSTIISIDLQEEGLNEIKVTDNGDGMDKDDMVLSTKRHATSKIQTEHDLFHIASLGFRGEAIPSIASVSHMEIISGNGALGHRIFLLKGELKEQGEYAPRKGTQVTVRYLFYNTPARLKHLKSTSTELSYIVDYINKIALSHPEIAFTLTNNKKTLFQSSGSNDIKKVLSNIYALDIIKNMYYFEGKNNYFTIHGYMTKPIFTRSTRNHINVIANQRMIKNNRIINAVVNGYKTYLPVGKYPIVSLFIELDPLLIDVNIHPQKLDVKFTEERLLHQLITTTIRQRLETLELIPQITKEEPVPKVEHQTLNLSGDGKDTTPLIKEDFVNFMKEKVKKKVEEELQEQQEKAPKEESRTSKIPRFEYIGQFMGTYLLCQNEEGLYIIDQHAAAERIRYERYIDKMATPSIDTYELIIPITLELSNQEVIALQDKMDMVKQLGLELVDNNHQGLDITIVPTWFREGFERIYAEEIVHYILEGKDITIKDVRDSLAKSLACKHSIKANKYINTNEIDVLLRDLEQCINPYTCPHGRPVIIHFSVNDVEKMFKRIQS